MRVAFLLVLPILAILLASIPARAGIYTYVDENSTIHFTNVPTDPQYKMIIPPKEEKPVSPDLSGRGGDISHLSLRAKRSNLKTGSEQAPKSDFNRLIEAKSYKYGLDPALVKAVIAVESDFNPHATSVKGAMGLMQLMPVTAYELGVYNSFDPEANIDGGVRYLRYLLDYFNWEIDLALAAYHAGMMRVVQYAGIPPIPATHQYVKKVKSTYRRYILHSLQ